MFLAQGLGGAGHSLFLLFLSTASSPRQGNTVEGSRPGLSRPMTFSCTCPASPLAQAPSSQEAALGPSPNPASKDPAGGPNFSQGSGQTGMSECSNNLMKLCRPGQEGCAGRSGRGAGKRPRPVLSGPITFVRPLKRPRVVPAEPGGIWQGKRSGIPQEDLGLGTVQGEGMVRTDTKLLHQDPSCTG
jgi:hypothetical protein